ncbi:MULTISPECIES: DNA phosphorothioation-dependent restriction protein DptF [Allobacillus]|nr:DNA phosphorothioation-dependent restriction protein DptF [Allobacillus salarius]
MSKGYLIQFLDGLVPKAFQSAKKIEDNIYTDPQFACISARITLEEIIDQVFNEESIVLRFDKLFDKIIHLDNEGYLTQEIKRSMDTIRSLGNRAAHNSNFNDIEDAIKVFKATYQIAKWYAEVYSINTSVPEYRNPKPSTVTSNSKEELVNEVLNQLKGFNPNLTNIRVDEPDKSDKADKTQSESSISDESKKKTNLIKYKLKETESYLVTELKRLQESSQEAIESPENFSELKDYLHVDRQIQLDLEKMLEKENSLTRQENRPSLILLSGSVGDGKSHLLSYLKEKKAHLIEDYKIYNDATESFDPHKSAIDTLNNELDGFSDQKINKSNDKIIIAINLGILNNFLEADHGNKTFHKLKKFIENSNVFQSDIAAYYSENEFNILSFSDYQTFELSENGPDSSFFSGIFNKVFNFGENNPFYQAYKLDEERDLKSIVHENFSFMANKDVQKKVVRLLINTIAQDKLVITARSLFNLIADLVIPRQFDMLNEFEWGPIEKLNYTTPNLLFDRKERSYILKSINKLDPINYRTNLTDSILIELNTLDDWNHIIDELISEEISYQWLDQIAKLRSEFKEEGENFLYSSEEEFFKTVIRTAFLTSDRVHENIAPKSFDQYFNYLYSFNTYDIKKIEEFYKKAHEAIYAWKGSPKNKYIYINSNGKFKVAQYLSLSPYIDHLKKNEQGKLSSFTSNITIAFHSGDASRKAFLDVDYSLFKLILEVLEGYCPNKKDEEDAIQFTEFIDQLMEFGNYKDELLIHIPEETKLFRLEKNQFGGYLFEREK